jgi:hypothetical protein
MGIISTLPHPVQGLPEKVPEAHLFDRDFPSLKYSFERRRNRRVQVDAGRYFSIYGNIEIPKRVFCADRHFSREKRRAMERNLSFPGFLLRFLQNFSKIIQTIGAK